MDKYYHLFVNTSPIVTIVLVGILCAIIESRNFILQIVFSGFCGFYIELFFIVSKFSYGHTAIAIIMQLVFFIIGLLFLVLIICSSSISLNVFDILCYSICTLHNLYCIYTRLKFENKMQIELVDKILNNLSSIDYWSVLKNIIENEWFKGIAIAAIGGIISGLVLKKSNKNGK